MTPRPLAVVELGLQPYGRAHALQHRLVAARQQGNVSDVLLLLEHEPVITLGRRADPENVLVTAESLQEAGIELVRIERGGDVTYHGPGQLVGYPIIDLASLGLGPSDYMHGLEDVIMAAMAEFGIVGARRKGQIGVWVDGDKICAMGVRVSKRVTYHGFALNVDPIMDHWRMIIPCGIRDGFVTSMAVELGQAPSMEEVRSTVLAHFAAHFGMTPVARTLAELGVADG
ncbi:MAG: lipoyl(octanoyl) transferase LipB [Anaerolineae bacterium]